MGLKLPKRAQHLGLGLALGLTLLFLGACSAEDKAQAKRWAMPANSPGTEQAVHIADLWKWAWIALLITGVLVWGLIFWCIAAYRRRSEDEVPVQTRYNLPLEVLYTVVPVFAVVVFFYWTITVQDKILEDKEPDVMVEVVAQQWSWTFNHSDGDAETGGPVIYEGGTASKIPTLVLPVDQRIEFRLSSPDVIHSFWIPGFLMKMDVIPGQEGDERNHFQVTTTTEGDFMGKCAELCGTYHSRMLFNVKVVSQDEYQAYLQKQKDAGFSADEPLLGGSDAITQARDGVAHNTEGGEQ